MAASELCREFYSIRTRLSAGAGVSGSSTITSLESNMMADSSRINFEKLPLVERLQLLRG